MGNLQVARGDLCPSPIHDLKGSENTRKRKQQRCQSSAKSVEKRASRGRENGEYVQPIVKGEEQDNIGPG